MPNSFDDDVVGLRGEIDGIDAEIVDLVLRRARVSRQIQRCRMAAGGVRIDLAREREIVKLYCSRLGGAGAFIATKILLHCRGVSGTDNRDVEQLPDVGLVEECDR